MTTATTPDDPWVTFDCYGTLVDWDTGMRAAVAQVVDADDVDAVIAAYHHHEPSVQDSATFRPYRTVMAEALAAAAADVGTVMRDPDVLARTLPEWPVYADVPDALAELRRRGWRIGILSNIDTDLLEATLPTLGVPIDAFVTAQQVQRYKPHLAHFSAFRSCTGAASSRWIHAACSSRHDVQPATAMGLRTIFVHRAFPEDQRYPATTTLEGLQALPDVLDELLRSRS